MDLAARRRSQAVAPMMGLIAAKRMSRHWASRVGGGRNSSVSAAAPVVKLENTYRLEPKSKFDVKGARDIVQELLREQLEDKSYNERTAVMLAKSLTDTIKNRLKSDLYFERYRLIVYLTISQQRNQSMAVSSRCVWNDRVDTSLTASFCNQTLACVATVFAVALE